MCEEKSEQIWPKRGPLGPFQAKFGGIPRLGPPSCALWASLGGFDTLQGYFELFCSIWRTLGTCAKTLGHASASGGTMDVEAHRRVRGGLQRSL